MSKTVRLAAVAALILTAFACLLFSGWVGQPTVRAIDDLALPAFSAVAAAYSALAARSTRGRIRSGWVAMAIALTGFAIGEAIWCYDDLILEQAPFPSPADGFFLIFPVGVCAALLFFRSPTSRQSQGQIVLDGLIVAGSLFIVSWTLVMKQIYLAGAATRLEVVLLIAYPVADLVILTVAAVVVVSARSGQRAAMSLLVLGVFAMALADTGYAYLSAQKEYVAGDRLDVVWVAGLLLLTLAAEVGRKASLEDHRREELSGWASVWFPYVPLMAAVAVAARNAANTSVWMRSGGTVNNARRSAAYIMVRVGRRCCSRYETSCGAEELVDSHRCRGEPGSVPSRGTRLRWTAASTH